MRRGGAVVSALSALLVATGCFARADTPRGPPPGALAGHAPDGFDAARACGAWEDASGDDPAATTHVSFPEVRPEGCFVPVRYDGDALPSFDAIPQGCGYPGDLAVTRVRLEREALRYERLAAGAPPDADTPMALACALPDEMRRAAAAVNARTLRATSRRIAGGRVYPYSAVGVFGFGHPVATDSALVPWRPADGCRELPKREMEKFGVNIVRAARGAAAQLAGVAPVLIVSGGAVHSPLVEAFLLHQLATCRFGVQPDAMLLDPCADHTHTNVRNVGGLVQAIGGRTAYVVTDDGLQADYLQEWTLFDVIGGSIDQRALRDWGYLIGSWRQASVGIDAGFWFTPYRFWVAPRDGLGSFSCVK